MESAMRKLYLCHSQGNAATAKCGTQHRAKAVVGATAAASPLTQTQRALLHTAIQRSRAPQQQANNGKRNLQQQQQQQMSPEEMKLRANMLRVQQLVAQTLSRPQQQPQISQPVHPAAQHNGDSNNQPLSGAPHGNHQQQWQQQQQHQSQGRAGPVPADQQQQQQLLRQQLLLKQLLQQQQVRQRRLQLQLRNEPAVLTALIKRCNSWQHLQHLFKTHTAHFNAVHVSAALTHLAQLQGPISPAEFKRQPEGLKQLMHDLISAAGACIPDYGARQLANTIWAISKLGCGSKVTRRLRSSSLTAFEQKLPGAAPQHISSVALAVARMGWGTSTQLQQCLLQEAQNKQQYFRPQELANLLYALPQLEVQPSQQWLSGWLETCYGNLHSFKSQELSLLGIALVRLKQRPTEKWLRSYMQAIQMQLDATAPASELASTSNTNISSSNSSGSANSMLGQGQQQEQEQQQQQQQAAEQDGHSPSAGQQLAGFQAQGLANVLWVVAVWGVIPDTQWQSSGMAAVKQLLPDCTIQGLSTLVWALTKLQVPASSILSGQLLQQLRLLLLTANSTDVAMLMWSLGTLGVNNSSSSTGSSSSSGSTTSSREDRVSSGSSSNATTALLEALLYNSRRTMTSASSRDVVSLLVGAVRMQLRPDAGWLNAAAVEAHHHLASMNSIELSSTLLCLARLKHKPRMAFMTSFCSRSRQLLDKTAAAGCKRSRSTSKSAAAVGLEWYSPQSLANTLGAMAILQYKPPKAWSSSFLDASRQLLPMFAARDFAYCIWALAKLDIQPPQVWMDEFLVQLRQHIPTMASSELSAIIWALAELNHRPGVDWMQRFMDRVAALTERSSSSSASTALGHDSSRSVSNRVRRVKVQGSAAPAAAPTAADQSGIAAAAGAQTPRTPLQLSADFSSIILHGLTLWATTRLEYPSVPGVSSSIKEAMEHMGSDLPAHARSSSSAISLIGSRAGDGSRSSQLAGNGPLEAAAGAVTTSTSRDGYIVFHF